MKLRIQHHNHQPSPSFTALISSQLESLQPALQIDEAHFRIERHLESSPPFRVTAHLVTPGPDIQAEAVDHTLHAALHKLVAELSARIDHRHQKRARRVRSNLQQPAPRTNAFPIAHRH